MKKVVILVLCLVAFCVAQNPYKFSDAEKNLFLNAHNSVRKAWGMTQMLTWDDTLAADSLAYAQQCKVNPLTHSTSNGAYGENLSTYMATPKPATFPYKTMDYHVVNGWYPEEPNYNCQANTCDTTGGKMCGHLTQIVWASTTKVGCGIAYCVSVISGKTWYVQNAVCRYTPPGNYIGQHPLGTNGATKCPVYPTKLPPFAPSPVVPTAPAQTPVAPVTPVKPPTAPVAPVTPPTAPVAPVKPAPTGTWWSGCIADYWPTVNGVKKQQLTPCCWEPWKDSQGGKTWCTPNCADENDYSWPCYNLGTAQCPDGKALSYAKAEENADADSGLPMGAWIGIAVGIAVLIIIIIVVIIIVQKKKNDERV
jgi:pathogenesis-related protein 1